MRTSGRDHRVFIAAAALSLLLAPAGVWAQGYVYDSAVSTGSGPGGIAITALDDIVNGNTLAGSVVLWSGTVPSVTRTSWTNPLDGLDSVSLQGEVSTGPRGIAVDGSGRVYVQSNDTDHNLLVYDSSLDSASKRLRTSIATGNDGRIYAVDVDGTGRVYVLWYYNVPSGHNRLEVYAPVDVWGTTHEELPLSSTVVDGSGGSDAHEGMCVGRDGATVWVSYRANRSVERWTGSPSGGYALDGGFTLDLSDGHGFRGLALSGDESRVYVCDDDSVSALNRIIVVDATSGSILSETFSVDGQGSDSPYAVAEDSAGNLYVVHHNQDVVETYVWSSTANTPTPTPTVTPTPTSAYTPGQPEMRAMWVSRFEWPSSNETSCKNTITQIMNDLVNHNFNTVLFQIRGQMDVLYPSPYEPWSALLGGLGADPGWDPLQYAIDRAHERGLEFHAYINTHTCYQSGSQTPPAHTTPEHPFWLNCDASGSHDWLVCNISGTPVQWGGSNYVWCAPGVPEFCWWTRRAVLHVVSNYDVDGVHFDRIRTDGNGYSYDPISLARMAGPGNPNGLDFHDWTRDQITRMLNNIYAQILAIKPHVKVSASPFGIYDRYRFPSNYWGFTDGYDRWHQESQHWLEAGVVDALFPMIYWDIASPPEFDLLVQDWIDYRFGRHIYAGMASYKYDSTELIAEIEETRNRGGQGNCPFSYTSTSAAKFDAYLAGPYVLDATTPPMDWKDSPTTGVILGTIREETFMDVVTDAWVSRTASSYTWLSAHDGFYAMLNVPPGTYTVSASKPDVGEAFQPGVSVGAGEVVTVDLVLSTSPVSGWSCY